MTMKDSERCAECGKSMPWHAEKWRGHSFDPPAPERQGADEAEDVCRIQDCRYYGQRHQFAHVGKSSQSDADAVAAICRQFSDRKASARVDISSAARDAYAAGRAAERERCLAIARNHCIDEKTSPGRIALAIADAIAKGGNRG